MKKSIEEELRKEIAFLHNEIAALRWEIRALKAPVDVFGPTTPRVPTYPTWINDVTCKATNIGGMG